MWLKSETKWLLISIGFVLSYTFCLLILEYSDTKCIETYGETVDKHAGDLIATLTQKDRAVLNITDRILAGDTADFYCDNQVTTQEVASSTKLNSIAVSRQQEVKMAEFKTTLNFDSRKTVNAMQGDDSAGQGGYAVTKLYTFKGQADGSREVYQQFKTNIPTANIQVTDEVSYNNFKLIGWYTLDNSVEFDTTNGFGALPPFVRSGTEGGSLILKGKEAQLLLVYEFQPAVEQINVVKMVYGSDGLHIDTVRVPFPPDSILSLDTIYSGGKLIGARGTSEDTYKFVADWQDTQDYQQETLIGSEENKVQLDTGIKTLYLHVLDNSILDGGAGN